MAKITNERDRLLSAAINAPDADEALLAYAAYINDRTRSGKAHNPEKAELIEVLCSVRNLNSRIIGAQTCQRTGRGFDDLHGRKMQLLIHGNHRYPNGSFQFEEAFIRKNYIPKPLKPYLELQEDFNLDRGLPVVDLKFTGDINPGAVAPLSAAIAKLPAFTKLKFIDNATKTITVPPGCKADISVHHCAEVEKINLPADFSGMPHMGRLGKLKEINFGDQKILTNHSDGRRRATDEVAAEIRNLVRAGKITGLRSLIYSAAEITVAEMNYERAEGRVDRGGATGGIGSDTAAKWHNLAEERVNFLDPLNVKSRRNNLSKDLGPAG